MGATGTRTSGSGAAVTAQATLPLRVALLGNPNCGKTALFNILTGSRQKVANYAGVTVERKVGALHTPSGRLVEILDLPGAYSLNAMSADESVTRDIVTGQRPGEPLPDLLVCVTDATNLRLNLRLVLEAKKLGLPMLLALNMSDMARAQHIQIDVASLSQELGMPVLETVGIRADGAAELVRTLDAYALPQEARGTAAPGHRSWQKPALDEVLRTQAEVRRILSVAMQEPVSDLHRDDAVDRVVLHPVWGMVLLAGILFMMFQAVFSWAEAPMDAIKAGTDAVASAVSALLPAGILQSLLVNGIIAGVGGVLVFLPQILILFFFILALEDSGYLPRAAFLLDRVMGTVGLSGRSFIPLLSSFACAIPGVMATRTITNWRDRLVTIMIAPLMTCSARLPVYALLIAAFIPARPVAGVFNLQGVVLVLPVPGRNRFGHGGGLGVEAPARNHRAFAADDGASGLPHPQPAAAGAGLVGACADLFEARRHHHPDPHHPALVFHRISGAAGGCHRPGDPVQPGRHDRLRPAGAFCADRLQLADFGGAGAGAGCS